MTTTLCSLVFALPLAFLACTSGDGDDGGSGGMSGSGGSGGSGGSAGSNVAADPRCETSNCPSEPETYDTKALCEALLNDICYEAYDAHRLCALENETCTADGKQDVDSLEPCDELYTAIFECVDAKGG